MNIAGERILIFGDSLTHHGASDAPEAWEANGGANRTTSAPGDLLASLLLDGGAQAVRTNANVSRSAANFWAKTAKYQFRTAQALLAADAGWRPTKVIVWLGTNDADVGRMNPQAIAAIRDAYQAMGAEVIALGPPTLPGRMAAAAEGVYATLRQTFGTVIDTRPLTANAPRTGDGVHFTSAGAKLAAPRLYAALATPAPDRSQPPAIQGALVVGGIIAIGLALVWALRHP